MADERAQLADADLDALATYVRRVADQLGLRDWTLTVALVEMEDQVAECEVLRGRRCAVLKVRSDFRALRPDEQRYVVLHELLHPHFHGPAMVVRGLAGTLGALLFPQLWVSYESQVELSVDALAGAFAPLMPLIDWDGQRGSQD